jgi:hypothetical protein
LCSSEEGLDTFGARAAAFPGPPSVRRKNGKQTKISRTLCSSGCRARQCIRQRRGCSGGVGRRGNPRGGACIGGLEDRQFGRWGGDSDGRAERGLGGRAFQRSQGRRAFHGGSSGSSSCGGGKLALASSSLKEGLGVVDSCLTGPTCWWDNSSHRSKVLPGPSKGCWGDVHAPPSGCLESAPAGSG